MRTVKIIFIFLAVNLLYINMSLSFERKEETINYLKRMYNNSLLSSIDKLVQKADLIIYGEIISVEKENRKEYAVIQVKEFYKGWSSLLVVMKKRGVYSSHLTMGTKGIFFLSERDKRIYQIVTNRYSFLMLQENDLYCNNLRINFEEYIMHLKKIIASQPKTEEEKKQEAAVEIAKQKAIQLGYDIKNMVIDIDSKNTIWKRYSLNNKDPEVIEKLGNKEYWAIHFELKEINIHDGDLWVFVDKDSGEVLYTLKGGGGN